MDVLVEIRDLLITNHGHAGLIVLAEANLVPKTTF